jgi:hypothetical protein
MRDFDQPTDEMRREQLREALFRGAGLDPRLRRATAAPGRLGVPVITAGESSALRLGARALADVAAILERRGQGELAAESARGANALEALRRRAAVCLEEGEETGP